MITLAHTDARFRPMINACCTYEIRFQKIIGVIEVYCYLKFVILFRTACPVNCNKCTYIRVTGRTECSECDAGYTMSPGRQCEGNHSILYSSR